MKVGILGAGAYGKALSSVLLDNEHATYFYDPLVYPERALEDVVEFAEAILLVTPAGAIEKLLKSAPREMFDRPLIVATKGILGLENWEKFRKYEIISGPGFASDIIAKKRVKLTVAGQGATGVRTLSEELFENSHVKFDKTEDVLGVAMLSGLKNIYAIEAGRRGLKVDTEEFREYIGDALLEAEKFLLYNGGFVETVRLSAGVGDFMLTCGGEESRNYRFGQRLKQFEREGRKSGLIRPRKLKVEVTTEGLFAAKEIRRRGLGIPRELEILPDILRRIEHATKR